MRRKGQCRSQTEGKTKRSDTCQLKTIGGLPRKAYCAARGYKLRNYHLFCAHANKVNFR